MSINTSNHQLPPPTSLEPGDRLVFLAHGRKPIDTRVVKVTPTATASWDYQCQVWPGSAAYVDEAPALDPMIWFVGVDEPDSASPSGLSFSDYKRLQIPKRTSLRILHEARPSRRQRRHAITARIAKELHHT